MVPISPHEEEGLKIADHTRQVCADTQRLIKESRESLSKAWLAMTTARRVVDQLRKTSRN